MGEELLRVGQLAAHLGVSTHALRAWESRYGLFRPSRSGGGYRLYDATDLRRGEEMRERIALGSPAGEAARLVLRRFPHAAPDASPPGPLPAVGDDAGAAEDLLSTGQREQRRMDLLRACAQLDEPMVRRLLAEASDRLATDDFVDEIVVPLLRAVTVSHDDPGALSIAHAHFAGNLVRTALLARQRRALAMDAPRLWLACPPREMHDLGLMAFGLVAAEEGWAVRFFGANTPLASLAALARKDPPAAVVLSATRPAPLRSAGPEVAALAEHVPTAIGGPAARRTASVGIGVPALPGDIVTEARALRRTLGLAGAAD